VEIPGRTIDQTPLLAITSIHKTVAPTRTDTIMSSHADVLKISILGQESIHVGFHLIPYIFETILTTLPSSAYVLITDTNLSNRFQVERPGSQLGPCMRQLTERKSMSMSSSKPFLSASSKYCCSVR